MRVLLIVVAALLAAAWPTAGSANPLPLKTSPEVVEYAIGVEGAACPEDPRQLIVVIYARKDGTTYKYIATPARWVLVEWNDHDEPVYVWVGAEDSRRPREMIVQHEGSLGGEFLQQVPEPCSWLIPSFQSAPSGSPRAHAITGWSLPFDEEGDAAPSARHGRAGRIGQGRPTAATANWKIRFAARMLVCAR